MFKRILYTLLVLIGINGLSIADSPLQSRRFLNNNGGKFDHISPLLVPDNGAGSLENITMDDRGQLTKRNGYTVIGSTSSFTTTFSTWVVTGGTFHKAATGSDFFTVVVGTSVFRIVNSFSSYNNVSGPSITPLATNLAQATHLSDEAVFCNDVDKPFYVGSSGNAVTISTNTFSAAKTCSTYGVYLVVGNTTESSIAYPNRIRWSDINNINSFPILNYIDVEPSDGDSIVGIVQWDESVYIFKHRSIYRMLITGLDGPDAFIIRPVARGIGAWSKMSIQAIPSVGIAFLAQNTAYLYNGYTGLTPIGDPIQRTFDGVLRSQWAQTIGGVYPKKYQYWLAISTSGTSNTEVLVFDYIQHNWTLYDGMNIAMMAQSETSTGDNVLITGDYSATTYKQDNGTVDFPHGVSTNITGSYTTGDLFTDSIDITKAFKYLYITTKGDINYTVNVNAAYDLGTNYEYSNSITIGSPQGTYNTAVYDTGLYANGSNTISRLELNRSAKTMRLQFTESDSLGGFGVIGWTVVYSMEDYRQ